MCGAIPEVFGPMLSIIRFREDEEAYAIANDTTYGLAGGVWTNDQRRMFAAAKRLRAGAAAVFCWRDGGHLAIVHGTVIRRHAAGREGYSNTNCASLTGQTRGARSKPLN
jgi:aldehyde dehydrogenase (NAD+)